MKTRTVGWCTGLGVTGGDALTADLAEQIGLKRDARGMVVTEIEPGSPADEAGLRRSDVVVALNGQTVNSWEELRLLVAQTLPGSEAKLRIMRDGKPRDLKVTVGRVVENPDELFAGVDVAPLSPDARRRLGLNDPRISGLVITRVAEDSPHRDRLAKGQVILEVNRGPVPDLKSARERVRLGRNLVAVFDGRGVRYVVVNVR